MSTAPSLPLAGNSWPVWAPGLLAFLAGLACLLGAYWGTVATMANLWWTSPTFAHGLVVYPVALWLAWRERGRLASASLRPRPAALGALAALVALWLLGDLVAVSLVKQAAVVAMVPALAWLCFGGDCLRALWFPFAFTVFAVPFGEGLVPHLMDFTADFTVGALKRVGIPVYRDGMQFSIPSGDFEVAKACSGIRYLIASLALGTLYAYLTYRSWWRRGLFMLAALLVPILANGLRAFGIVILAHLTDMRLAVGVDHLIYGWLFFGVVVFLLFWVGGFFRETAGPNCGDAARVASAAVSGAGSGASGRDGVPRARSATGIDGNAAASPGHGGASAARLALLVPAALVVLAAGPLVGRLLSAPAAPVSVAPAVPAPAAGWRGPLAPALAWTPAFPAADGVLRVRFVRERDAAEVEVAVVVYARQQEGQELVSDVNAVADEARWREVERGFVDRQGRGRRAGNGDTGTAPRRVAARTLVHPPQGPRRFWFWYVVGQRTAATGIGAKLLQAREAVTGAGTGAVGLVALATMVDDTRGERNAPGTPGADGAGRGEAGATRERPAAGGRAAAGDEVLEAFLAAHATGFSTCALGGSRASGCRQTP